MPTRREMLLGAMALGACAQVEPSSPASPPPPFAQLTDDPRFRAIEERVGGRIGLAAINTANDAWLAHRPYERFAMASTFKWMLAAHMLQSDMRSPGWRQERVLFLERHLLDYAPVTRARIVEGPYGRYGEMTVEELCEAIVVHSDNTAANLLLDISFGPEDFTRSVRMNGDGVTRLDRKEPHLNENAPGDERDTTAPYAMALSLQRYFLTDEVLDAPSRDLLIGWMAASQTGLRRLRAGLPPDWRVGDKTGTGRNGAVNDVAIAWPPGRPPIVIASYMSESQADTATLEAAHAEIARIVTQTWT